ncbi:MAG TPA: carboxylesterase family protein [Streptosporangiaceae bacterium]
MTELPIASTTSGTLRGRVEDGLGVFRGVPYAAPPVGPARWKAAQPHPGWDGVRDATEYGPSAPQPWLPGGLPPIGSHGEPPFVENCLTLNVWTPGIDDFRRPVLVWIHGGGFLTGSGNLPFYAADTFARDGDVVAISINYRLGPLGFLSGVGDANVWLTDQVAALRWIVANVTAFGGDPARITLAGQSGGAFSIAALAQHPDTQGLFQRGILQSPPLGLDLPSADDAVERTRSLARHLGHTDLEALHHEPWERLIEGTISVLGEYTKFGEWALAFLPVIDEATLPRHPVDALADADIDLVIGWNSDEASFAFGMNPQYAATTREQVIAWAGTRYGDRAESRYDAYAQARADSRPLDVLTQIVTDDLFRRSGLHVADARAGSRPVHAYQFEVSSRLLDGALGATHCMELPFTFANISRWGSAPFIQGLPPEVVERVAGVLHSAWTGFARDGDPNREGVPSWRHYKTDDRAVLVVGDDNIRVVTDHVKVFSASL